jgi:hypothetical protein
MVELVDTSDLKSDDLTVVRVQFPLRVHKEKPHNAAFFTHQKKPQQHAVHEEREARAPSLLEDSG